jgi:nucleotide-binding universal stress UspA family protein
MDPSTADLTLKISEIKDSNTQFLAELTTYKVIDAETHSKASEYLSQMKKRMARIEDWRKFFTKPLNDQVSSINSMFKMQSEPLKEAYDMLAKTVVRYMDEEEEKARKAAEEARKKAEEERKKAEAEAKKNNKPVEEIVPVQEAVVEVPAQIIRTDAGKIVRKKNWTFKIIDLKETLKTNPELFELNEKLVRKLIDQGIRDIKGLEIYQESSISTYK